MAVRRWSLLALLLLAGLSNGSRVKRVMGGGPAPVPPERDPSVLVETDGREAWVYGTREEPGGYYAFRGIRFAEPPIGRYRFQRARRHRLDGEVNATEYGPPCPQRSADGRRYVGQEDCLTLNVFLPDLPDEGERLPVIVWIHGGSFRHGSASQYGPRHLVDKKLIVVTVQYRLGSLGFLSTGLKEQPGNVGLFDITLALDWVKEHIEAFGGDPGRLTVSGQDCGASAAVLVGLSKMTHTGYLSSVIAMSGTALSAFAVDPDPMGTCRALAVQNGCPTSPVLAMVHCLQDLPVEKILEADAGLQAIRLTAQGLVAGLAGLLTASPVVDGEDDGRFIPNFVQKSPLELLSAGTFPGIPLLTGVVKDPMSTALLGKLRPTVEERIRSVPKFFETTINDLAKNTFNSVANKSLDLVTQITSVLLPQASDTLARIIEASSDALFNLPAFQTAQLWSKKAPTFFYSFDHDGKKKGGPVFLPSSPLTQLDPSKDKPKGVGHGDDLLYVFEPNGASEDERLEDNQDVQVRETMTSMIAEFVRSGVPAVMSGFNTSWVPFSQGDGNFMSIGADSKPSEKFRFCQMALWTGLTEQLQSVACQAFRTLQGVVGGATSLIKPLGQTLNVATGSGKKPSGLGGLGLLGG